mgnify:CR=1 FL=1
MKAYCIFNRKKTQDNGLQNVRIAAPSAVAQRLFSRGGPAETRDQHDVLPAADVPAETHPGHQSRSRSIPQPSQ